MKEKIFLTLAMPFLMLLGIAGNSLLCGAEADKLVQDSMKRFSIQIPSTWKATENSDGNAVSIAGDDVMVVISPVFRGTNIDLLQHNMALQYALRSVEGPPKKNKVKVDKVRVGNLKAFESEYNIKGGDEDKYKEYHVRIISIDGDKHKFCIVSTVPMGKEGQSDLESQVQKLVDSFKELD